MLSIVIPSCGRSTLENVVNGLLHQHLYEGDEIIVVGPRPPNVTAEYFNRNLVRHIPFDNGGCHSNNESTRPGKGGPEKDAGFAAARGDYILTIDDDDIYMKDALQEARRAVVNYPGRLHVFRMQYGIENQWMAPLRRQIGGRWEMGFEDKGVIMGNVGGSMYIYPKIPNAPQHSRGGTIGDEDFYTFLAYGKILGAPIWHDRAWSIIRPSLADLKEHVGDNYVIPHYTRQPMKTPVTDAEREEQERWRRWRDLGGAGFPPDDWDGQPDFRPTSRTP